MFRAEELSNWARGNAFTVRLVAFYIAIFFLVGCYMPFLPVWLRARGINDEVLAFMFAMPQLLRPAFTPAMSFAADHYGRPLTFLKTMAWGTFISALLLPLAVAQWQIIAAFFLLTMFWISVIPITEAITLKGARDGHNDYGRVRLWGSFAFMTMTVVGGAFVKLWGPTAAISLLIGSAVTVLFAAYIMTDPAELKPRNGGAEPVILPRIRLVDMARLIRSPELWLMLGAVALIQSAHAVYYIFGTLHWQSINISPTIIGLLWATGVLAEITLFAYASRLPKALGPLPLIFIGGAAGILRWSVTAFDPSLPILFVMQALHGLTYGATHLGAIHFMQRAIPEQLAVSAQGLYASMSAGFVMGTVSLASGPLHQTMGGHAYLVMTVLCVAGLTSTWALAVRWKGGVLIPTAPGTVVA